MLSMEKKMKTWRKKGAVSNKIYTKVEKLSVSDREIKHREEKNPEKRKKWIITV